MRPWLVWILAASCTPAVPAEEPVEAAPSAPPREAPEPSTRIETLESGARRLYIEDPATYWERNDFATLAPTVRLAISAVGRPHVTVRLKLPDGSVVKAKRLEAQGRHTLVFPPGTVADRVSMMRYSGGLTVADVRGSRIDDQGREWFHVYRPSGAKPNSALIGYEWLRDDPAQREEATTLLVEQVRTTPRPFRRVRPSRGYVRFFARMNECESCHFADKAAGDDPDDWLPLWPTDHVGWYVPMAVMLPELALSTTPTWHDPNVDDDLVSTRCRTGPARTRTRRAGSWFRCDDGSVPHGVRDFARGLERNDAYTAEVCRSRRLIYRHMDAEAKAAFAVVMAQCEPKR